MFRFLRGLFVLLVLAFYVLVLPAIGVVGVYHLLVAEAGKGC